MIAGKLILFAIFLDQDLVNRMQQGREKEKAEKSEKVAH